MLFIEVAAFHVIGLEMRLDMLGHALCEKIVKVKADLVVARHLESGRDDHLRITEHPRVAGHLRVTVSSVSSSYSFGTSCVAIVVSRPAGVAVCRESYACAIAHYQA